MTEPLYRPIRRIMPDFGALDLSPLVVLLVICILSRIVIPQYRCLVSEPGRALTAWRGSRASP